MMSSAILWNEFVAAAATAYQCGEDELIFANQFRGRGIEWRGWVASNDSCAELLSGIDIRMPHIEIPMRDGSAFVGEVAECYRELDVGSDIQFIARFPERHVVKSFIRFFPDPDQQMVFMTVGLKSAG